MNLSHLTNRTLWLGILGLTTGEVRYLVIWKTTLVAECIMRVQICAAFATCIFVSWRERQLPLYKRGSGSAEYGLVKLIRNEGCIHDCNVFLLWRLN